MSGGLNMVNLEFFEKSLKLTWLKQLMSAKEKLWIHLFIETVGKLDRFLLIGGKCYQSKKGKLNPFWQKVFEYWEEYCKHLKVKTNEDIMTSSIWLNPKISSGSLFLPDWYKHGINTIGDIINAQGSVLSLQHIRQKFDLTVNVLNYYTVKNYVKDFVEHNKKDSAFDYKKP